MKPRIKFNGEMVATTRSTTTVESTTFYQKAEHLSNYIDNKLKQMGVKPEVVRNKI